MSDGRASYVPSPLAMFKLRVFGQTIFDLIDERPYLVGSVLTRSDYRDVDVRIMLDDEKFEAVFGGDGLWVTNDALKLFNMGLSALGREMTGLDVDCQFQRLSDANTEYGDEPRNALLGPSAPADPDVIPSPLLAEASS